MSLSTSDISMIHTFALRAERERGLWQERYRCIMCDRFRLGRSSVQVINRILELEG